MNEMNITLQKVLFDTDILDEFGCCKLIIDDEVVWDDDVEWNKYVRFTDALDRYFASHKDWDNYRVVDVNIQVVHFHHSIISIHCQKEVKV